MDVNRTLTNMIRREMIEQYNIGQIVLLMCILWTQNCLYEQGSRIKSLHPMILLSVLRHSAALLKFFFAFLNEIYVFILAQGCLYHSQFTNETWHSNDSSARTARHKNRLMWHTFPYP